MQPFFKIDALRHTALSLLMVGMAVPASAQQNLFNMPSGDITPKGKYFYQHQINLYANKGESKAHFVYGLGQGWDVGANLVGKAAYFSPQLEWKPNMDASRGPLGPSLLLTAQKQWKLSEKLALNTGIQAGPNLSLRLNEKALNTFVYAVGNYTIAPGHRIVAGPYWGNRMLLGPGNELGLMAGFESHVAGDFYLMGDWYSGRNDAGVAVLGAMYSLSRRVQLCAGYATPNPQVRKQPGLVLELNILGWDYSH